ncbi:MAG: hypothetical protein IKT09_04960 [Synergistes sp.]|nr:hypothetical protein [Synergistes sp.]
MSPETATFSKASAADVAFTVTGATALSSVKNGATTLTASTDYTFSSGTLKILDDYLGTLNNGDVKLDITSDKGVKTSVIITVGA